jgi:hypothetical protein
VIPLIEQWAAMWGGMIRSSAGEPFFAQEPVGLSSIEQLV